VNLTDANSRSIDESVRRARSGSGTVPSMKWENFPVTRCGRLPGIHAHVYVVAVALLGLSTSSTL
jgi:hypothetical protein